MQDHFNGKDYMNSDRFTKAEFNGNIINLSAIKFATNGTYPATADGVLTIHGVSKKITVTGTLTVDGNNLQLKSAFKIHVSDYAVPGSEVAENIDITVTATYN